MASCTCQSLLLERMLKIYEDMFKDVNKNGKKEVKNNLTNVMSEVKNLRHKYNSVHKVWTELQNIDLVKVNIQRKSCLHCEKCKFLVVELLFMI